LGNSKSSELDWVKISGVAKKRVRKRKRIGLIKGLIDSIVT
jgi:hypothetical protein